MKFVTVYSDCVTLKAEQGADRPYLAVPTGLRLMQNPTTELFIKFVRYIIRCERIYARCNLHLTSRKKRCIATEFRLLDGNLVTLISDELSDFVQSAGRCPR